MRILEVGCGGSNARLPAVGPAIENPGHLLAQEDVDYIGLDLPGGFLKYGLRSDGSQSPNDHRVYGLARRFHAVEANVSSLPFADAAFDLVMLRSVFGQFRDWKPEHGRGLNPQDLYIAGMFEIGRVLKPLGELVVAEENTEEEVNFVEYCLRSAGVAVTDFAAMTDHGYLEQRNQTDWYRLRSRYYGQSEKMLCLGARTPGKTIPYVLVAQKPDSPIATPTRA